MTVFIYEYNASFVYTILRQEINMSKSISNLLKDIDSGIDYDYSSSSDYNSSQTTIIKPEDQLITFSYPDFVLRKRIEPKGLIEFPTDGIIERIRPITLKNSENSDFIICQTDRGAYIAHRTKHIPQWVAELARQINFEQNWQ